MIQLALAFLVSLGVGRHFPFQSLGQPGLVIGHLLWLAVTLAFFIFAFRYPVGQTGSAEIKARLFKSIFIFFAFLTPVLDLANFLQFQVFGYQNPLLLIAFDLIGFVALTFLPRKILSAVIFSCLHLMIAIHLFPIDARRSDMLELIKLGNEYFMMGQNPYHARFNPQVGLPYPPLMWLSFLPAVMLKIDLRWMTVFFRLSLGVFLAFKYEKQPARSALIALFFLNPYLLFRHDLYLDFFFLLLALSFVFASEKRVLASQITSILGCLCIHWFWIVTPFVWMLATSGKRFTHLVRSSLVTLLAIIGGYVLAYHFFGDPMFGGIFQGFRLIGTDVYFQEMCLGFAWPFISAGLTGVQVWIQRAVLLGFGVWGLRAFTSQSAPIGRIAFLSTLTFIAINPLVENYFYFIPMIIGMVADD